MAYSATPIMPGVWTVFQDGKPLTQVSDSGLSLYGLSSNGAPQQTITPQTTSAQPTYSAPQQSAAATPVQKTNVDASNPRAAIQWVSANGDTKPYLNGQLLQIGPDGQPIIPGYNYNAGQGYTPVQQQPAPQQSAQSGASGTLPPEFQQLYDQLNTYLQKLQQNGQVLNPNIDITPNQVAQFLSQAHTEIDPYYSGQLKLALDSLNTSTNYATQNLQNNETQTERNYGQQLRTLGENSAEQGFAQSGIRQRQEGNLAYDTQQNLDQARRQLSYDTGNAARTFAQSYGSASLPSPSIGNEPTVNAGSAAFTRPGGTSPLYQLSPDVYGALTGSQQYQQNADVQNRSSQLEGAFRTNQAIAQQRQLIL